MSRRAFGNNRNGGHRDAKQLSKNKNRFARIDPDIQGRYEDLDDDIAVPARVKKGDNPKNNPFRRNQNVANTGVKNADITYKIKIPHGARKFDQKWIVRQLNQKLETFKPILMAPNSRGDLEFFIRDEDTAMAIGACSKRIVHRETSSRVTFEVQKVPAPWMQLRKSDIDIINLVVDNRYNAENRVLDLSNFANDEEFTKRDMLMTLTKGNVMLAVVDRIDEKYGNITALSLSNNRLKHLDYAAAVVPVAKFVKVFDLSHNMVTSEEELEKFSGLPVDKFYFDGNPVNETMSSASAYLSFVQKTFPRCALLDGVEVKPLIEGPEVNESDVAPFLAGYYGNDEIRALVENFLIAYLQLYDGPDGGRTRKNLFEAYDENNSTFTLSIQNLRGCSYKRYPVDECYDIYIRQSHNVLTEEKFCKNRSSRVVRGSMEIAVALAKLPTTKHVQDTFIVDVFLVTNELLGFTVQGLFEDGILSAEGEVPELNFFQRTFTVAPRDGGRVAVISDLLFISSAATDRLERYKNLLETASKNGAAKPIDQVNQAAIAVDGLGFNGEPAREIRDKMIEAFCQFSGMIPIWSSKCLADFSWDYDAACKKFIEIKDNVPKEAFSH